MKNLYHVLLIEDNPGDRKLTQEAFKELEFNYELNMAVDGEKGVEAINQISPGNKVEPPNFVLLDLNMPKRNGFEVLAAIRGNKNLQDLPVIIMTTSASQEDVERAYQEGANCFVSKPVDYNKFVHCLKMIEQLWIKVPQLECYCASYKTMAT